MRRTPNRQMSPELMLALPPDRLTAQHASSLVMTPSKKKPRYRVHEYRGRVSGIGYPRAPTGSCHEILTHP